MVLTEPPTRPKLVEQFAEPKLFVLSAKDKTSLIKMCKEFVDYFSYNTQFASEQLLNIAYTLSVSREHFEYRTAWIACTVADCLANLTGNIEICFVERLKLNGLNQKEDFDNNTSIELLKNAYLNGDRISWESLFANKNCNRLSLPTYRFGGKKFDFNLTHLEHSNIEYAT